MRRERYQQIVHGGAGGFGQRFEVVGQQVHCSIDRPDHRPAGDELHRVHKDGQYLRGEGQLLQSPIADAGLDENSDRPEGLHLDLLIDGRALVFEPKGGLTPCMIVVTSQCAAVPSNARTTSPSHCQWPIGTRCCAARRGCVFAFASKTSGGRLLRGRFLGHLRRPRGAPLSSAQPVPPACHKDLRFPLTVVFVKSPATLAIALILASDDNNSGIILSENIGLAVGSIGNQREGPRLWSGRWIPAGIRPNPCRFRPDLPRGSRIGPGTWPHRRARSLFIASRKLRIVARAERYSAGTSETAAAVVEAGVDLTGAGFLDDRLSCGWSLSRRNLDRFQGIAA